MGHEATLSIGAAARYIGVSTETLRRWDASGKLVAYRTPTDRRRYTVRQLEEAVAQPAPADQPDTE